MAACRFGPDSSLCLIGAPRRYAAPHYHARDPGPSLYNGVRMGDHTQQPGRADPRTPDGHPAARRVLVMPAQPRKDRANDAAPPKGGGLTAGPRRQPRRGRTMVLLLFVCSLSGDRHFGKKKRPPTDPARAWRRTAWPVPALAAGADTASPAFEGSGRLQAAGEARRLGAQMQTCGSAK